MVTVSDTTVCVYYIVSVEKNKNIQVLQEEQLRQAV